jgi:hypothetical protein
MKLIITLFNFNEKKWKSINIRKYSMLVFCMFFAINTVFGEGLPVVGAESIVTTYGGVLFTYQLPATNSPILGYSASNLPPGLSINTSTGIISGYPTVSDIYTATLSATNVVGTGSNEQIKFMILPSFLGSNNLASNTGVLSLNAIEGTAFNYTPTVSPSNPSPPIITSGVTATLCAGTLFNYTITATGTPTFYDANPLPPGLRIDQSSGIISGTPTTAGNYDITILAYNSGGNGSAVLNLSVTSVPIITGPTIATGSLNVPFSEEVNGTSYGATTYSATGLPAGLSMSSTGLISGTPTESGTFNVTLSGTSVCGTGTQTLILTIPPPPPVITSASFTFCENQSVNVNVIATNNPTSYSASGLPAGLSINTSTGIITGSPTELGNFNVTINATNSGGSGSAGLNLSVISAPIITGPTTATGSLNVPFSAELTVSINSPTTYSATGLPAGLSMSSTGLISGTPTESGTFNVTLIGTNTCGTGTQTLILTIPPPPPPVITSPLAASICEGTPFSYTITATNNSTFYDAGDPLPAGLTINESTGVISGTPTTAGVYPIPIVAYNSGGNGTGTLTLTVNAAPVITSPITATGVQNVVFNYQTIASNNPTSYAASGLPAGLSINTSTGLISGTPTVTGTFTVTLSATNTCGIGTQTLTLTIPAPPIVTSGVTATLCAGTPFSYTITANNNPTFFDASPLPAGLTIDQSTGIISGTPTTAGNYDITIVAYNSGGNGSAVLILSVTSAPVITGPTTASGSLNVPFSQELNGTIYSGTTFSATGLPTGLTINSTTGLISGTPTESGTFNVTLSGTDVCGTGTQTLTLTIPPPAITSPLTASICAGTPFSYTITANNNPTFFDAGDPLPPGLTRNQSTGVISGTPTTAGIYAIPIVAYGQGGNVSGTLTLTVNAAPVITSPITTAGAQNVAFTYQTTASNNPTSYTASGLPAGLSINTSTGLISGTPTVTGTFTVSLSATNICGTGTQTLTLTIPPPAITSPLTASICAGTPFSYTITANNNPTFFDAGDPLPPGLTRNQSTGVISGTPTTAGVYAIPIVAYGQGGNVSGTLTLTVNAAPVITSPITAAGAQNVAFTYQTTASSNPTSYAASGLPAGLSINTYTGLISGTPTVTGTFTVILSATNICGTGIKTLMLTISGGIPVISSPINAVTFCLNQPINLPVIATNIPTSYRASGLPLGLRINPTTGVISGTPTESGTFAVRLRATNSYGTGTQIITITIPGIPMISNLPLAATGIVGVPFSYTLISTIPGSLFGLASFPFNFGLDINPTTGVISGVPTTAGVYHFTVTALSPCGDNGPLQALTITINPPVPVIINPPTTPITFCLDESETLPLIATNSPTRYTITGLPNGLVVNPRTGIISGRATQSGTFIVKAFATNSAGPGPIVSFTIIVPPLPVITGPLSVTDIVGEPFSYTPTSNSPSNTFSVVMLPPRVPGLAVNPTTGVISGTPTTPGTYIVEISAKNSCGISSTIQLAIHITLPPPVITPIAPLTVCLNTPVSIQVSATNSPTSYTATGLPFGVTINPSTGLISGTPTSPFEAGIKYNVIVTAKNAGGTGQSSFNLTIPSAPVITSPLNVTGTVGVPFSYTLTSNGPDQSISFTSSPPGLNLTGFTISGTPAAAGTYLYDLSASNSCTTVLKQLTVTIKIPVPVITPPVMALTYCLGKPITSLQINATNNPTSYTATGLPAGLSINSTTGVISGTPTDASKTTPYMVTVTATNAGGVSQSKNFTIIIPTLPMITSPLTVSGKVGTPFNYTLTVNVPPLSSYYITGGALPPGLSLNTSTGVISGTPTTVGTFDYSIAKNYFCSAGLPSTLVITITAPCGVYSILGPSTICQGVTSNPYSVTGVPPGSTVTWSITDDAVNTNFVEPAPAPIINCSSCTQTTLIGQGGNGNGYLNNPSVPEGPELEGGGVYDLHASVNNCPITTERIIVGAPTPDGTATGSNGSYTFSIPVCFGITQWTWEEGSGNSTPIYIPLTTTENTVNLSPNGILYALPFNYNATCMCYSANGEARPALIQPDNVTNNTTAITNEESTGYIISPNPASSIVNINAKDASMSNMGINSIIIYDMSGAQRMRQTYNQATQVSINVSDLASGTYLIEIFNGTNTQTQKIIIQR